MAEHELILENLSRKTLDVRKRMLMHKEMTQIHRDAAKAMGNDELFSKLEESCRLLRRDIVFASSLYVEM